MTRRITGNDIRTYSAGRLGEPYRSEMGYGPYYDVIARLVNQVTATTAQIEQCRAERALASAHTLERTEDGIRISLGEILADRIQDKPRIGDGEGEMTQTQWSDLCASRAHGYLEWLKPLLERET